MQQTSGFCPTCQRQVYATKPAIGCIGPAVLIILLFIFIWPLAIVVGAIWLLAVVIDLFKPFICNVCGSPVRKSGGFAVLVGGVLILVLIAAIVDPRKQKAAESVPVVHAAQVEPEKPKQPQPGERVVLPATDNGFVWLAADDNAMNELIADSRNFDKLVKSGGVYAVSRKEEVELVKWGEKICAVRVLSGPRKDEEGRIETSRISFRPKPGS